MYTIFSVKIYFDKVKNFENKDGQEMIIFLGNMATGEKSGSSLNKINNRIYYKDVIEYKTFITKTQAVNCYIVCLELLHHILCWIDVKFGFTI